MATIKAKSLKNGNISFVVTIAGRQHKIAEASNWKTGYTIERRHIDGRPADPVVTYDRADLEPVVISWAERLGIDDGEILN